MKARKARGPLSSIDLEHTASIDWMWGRPVRQVRAVLELLFAMGEVGIHHRINTRRYFDLMERVLSPEVFNSPDPNDTIDAYHDWHVLRRVGGLGLASSLASDCWLGIFSAKTPERRAAMARLIYNGSLIEAALENNGKQTVFLRAGDLPVLENVMQSDPPPAQATFLAPLDNLLWGRNMLRLLFDFDYTWEV